MGDTIASFDFSNPEELRNFFAYISQNIGVKRILVKIFPINTDHTITDGVKPNKISEIQKLIGPDNIVDRIPLCEYETGIDSFEICLSKIRKVEILEP